MTEIHDFADQAADDLPDPPRPQHFADIPEERIGQAMITGLRDAMMYADGDPFKVGAALEEHLPGMRRAWLRVLATQCGARITTEEAAVALQTRFAIAHAHDGTEPGPQHYRVEGALAGAIAAFALSAGQHND